MLEFYNVSVCKEITECKCRLFSDECNSCLHKFTCTCHDYTIQYNMCKHIHMICLKFIISKKQLEANEINKNQNKELVSEDSERKINCQELQETQRQLTKQNLLYYKKLTF